MKKYSVTYNDGRMFAFIADNMVESEDKYFLVFAKGGVTTCLIPRDKVRIIEIEPA